MEEATVVDGDGEKTLPKQSPSTYMSQWIGLWTVSPTPSWRQTKSYAEEEGYMTVARIYKGPR